MWVGPGWAGGCVGEGARHSRLLHCIGCELRVHAPWESTFQRSERDAAEREDAPGGPTQQVLPILGAHVARIGLFLNV